MARTDIPDAQQKIGSRDTDVPWYSDSIGSRLGPSARRLLEEYSHIPADQVESHIKAIRERAWQVWPYPCIGQFRFLDLSITLNAHYPTVLQRLLTSTTSTNTSTPPITFLDLGCCFGQDVRALAAAGAPTQNLYAVDLQRDFWELGYLLFQDRETLQARFIQADVLADDDGSSTPEGGGDLKALDGKIDILYAGSFLHLFDYAGQIRVCERIVKLLRPVKGSMCLGRQVGYPVAGERVHRTNYGGSMYRHNEESFRGMWKEVGEKTSTEWRVEVDLAVIQETGPTKHWDPDIRRLAFTVFRE